MLYFWVRFYRVDNINNIVYIVGVQLLSHVWLFETPWTAAAMLPCPFTISLTLLKFMSIEPVMHPTTSSSVASFSSCLQTFLALGSFLMSQLFTTCGQSIGASASASVLPMNIQGRFPLRLTALISLLSKELSVFSRTTVQKRQFFSTQPSLGPIITSVHDYWKNHSVDYMDLCWQSDISAFLIHSIGLSQLFFQGKTQNALQPTPVFLPRESYGQRSLVGYSPRSFFHIQQVFLFGGCSHHPQWFWSPRKSSLSLFPLFIHLFAMKWWDQMPWS